MFFTSIWRFMFTILEYLVFSSGLAALENTALVLICSAYHDPARKASWRSIQLRGLCVRTCSPPFSVHRLLKYSPGRCIAPETIHFPPSAWSRLKPQSTRLNTIATITIARFFKSRARWWLQKVEFIVFSLSVSYGSWAHGFSKSMRKHHSHITYFECFETGGGETTSLSSVFHPPCNMAIMPEIHFSSQPIRIWCFKV